MKAHNNIAFTTSGSACPVGQTGGFTIVETMLFLAVSGLLAAGILIGTGSSINTQRYRDSVTSLMSFFQKQYSDVANVSNDSTSNACPDDHKPRGQSDCVILGKYITSNGTTLSIKDVIGNIPAGTVSSNDLLALRDYDIKVSSEGGSTYDIEWGSSLTRINGTTMSLSMLVLRSPSSGIIRTFIDPSAAWPDGQIQAKVLLASNLTKSATACVNSNGLLTGTKLAVLIDKNATGTSGVEILGDNNGCL